MKLNLVGVRVSQLGIGPVRLGFAYSSSSEWARPVWGRLGHLYIQKMTKNDAKVQKLKKCLVRRK